MKTVHKRLAAAERPMEVAMTVIVQGPYYVFEMRPDNKAAGAANMIAAYGGQVEWGELADEAAIREIGEETNLKLKKEWLKRLGLVEVMSDRNGRPRMVQAHAYEVQIPFGVEVKPQGKAGAAIRIIHQDLGITEGYSPATGATVKNHYLKDEGESHGAVDY